MQRIVGTTLMILAAALPATAQNVDAIQEGGAAEEVHFKL